MTIPPPATPEPPLWRPPVAVPQRSLPPVKSRWHGGDLTFTPGVRIGITVAILGTPALLTVWSVWAMGLPGLTIVVGFVAIWLFLGAPTALKDVWAKETVHVPDPFRWDTPTHPPPPSLADWLAAQPPPE